MSHGLAGVCDGEPVLLTLPRLLGLATSVGGRRQPLIDRAVGRLLLTRPAATVAVIARIHWQALQLLSKRAKLHAKPAPPAQLVSR